MSFLVPNLSFGEPVASLWHPGGPWDDPGAPWSTRKETEGSRLGFLLISVRFRDLVLKAFWVLWTKIAVFYSCLFPGHFLTIWGFESGRLGLQEQAFDVRRVAKTSFHRSWNSVDFSVIF